MPVVFMYSGQGSQYFQMGADLYKTHARFRLWMDHCDELCQKELNGTSIVDVIYGGNIRDSFDNLIYTNPALVSIQYSITRILMEEGIKPTHTLGYSLGTLVAAIVSNTIDLEQGLNFSIRCAKLLKAKTPEARMLAVVANNAVQQEKSTLFKDIWVTGKNCDANFVVSGLPDPIDRLAIELKALGISTVQLPVRIGFHTSLIEEVEGEFSELFNEINIKQASIPMLSLGTTTKVTHPSRDYFWEIFRNPVDFSSGIKDLVSQGFRTFIDLGPSGSLATFLKYIESIHEHKQMMVETTLNQFGSNQLMIARIKSSMELRDSVSTAI